MQRVIANDLADLTAFVDAQSGDSLFRGQTRHFECDDGSPSVSTSFDRQGCAPIQMLKWSHYASFLLNTLLRDLPQSSDLEFNQAILQHYGWRSFFIDVSKSAAVSAWFASHSYSSKPALFLAEDCFEDPVFLRHEEAEYSSFAGAGHLYVFSKLRLAEAGIRYFDLAEMRGGGERPRFLAQSAGLVGPLRRAVIPGECFIAHVTGPAEVFRQYAAEGGFTETAHLFPTPREDQFLSLLQSLPWNAIKLPEDNTETKLDIEFFDQVVRVPDYHLTFRKHLPSSVAHYAGFKISEAGEALQGPFEKGAYYEIEPGSYFGMADEEPRPLPLTTEVLRGNGALVLEVDELIRFPESARPSEYGKGIFVELVEPSVVAIGDLVIDHPGQQVTGFGSNSPWHYRVNKDSTWARMEHPDDCPCGNVRRHEHHLRVLRRFEQSLAEGIFKKVGDRRFRHSRREAKIFRQLRKG